MHVGGSVWARLCIQWVCEIGYFYDYYCRLYVRLLTYRYCNTNKYKNFPFIYEPALSYMVAFFPQYPLFCHIGVCFSICG
jgi:hypothetical protein